MRVQLLGTGAADGWPQPFCRCASCAHARAVGIVRGRSGVLVDDRVLLDPSPDTAGAAARAGVVLDQVSSVLVGHGHHDHLDPAILLARHWAGVTSPLEVHGPVSALDQVRPWIDPAALGSGAVSLLPARVGEPVDLPSGHIARAHRAHHGLGANGHPSEEGAVEAVLWEVSDASGHRLLHAADTGPLPEASLADIPALDLLLVEETFGDVLDHGTAHLDLSTLPVLLASLRRLGSVTDATVLVATHLSHHNPPEPELVRRLAAWGVRAGRDLDVIALGGGDAGASTTAPGRSRTLVTGGARSGKSREAERLVAAHAKVTYVATAAPAGDDPEWDERVARHRERRPATWTTVETADVAGAIGAADSDAAVLVDCLTLWLARVIDQADAWEAPDRARAAARLATDRVVQALASSSARVVMVTNEVGSGIVPEHAGSRLFRDLLGETNARVAAACDDVLLAVAGQVLPMRGAPSYGGAP